MHPIFTPMFAALCCVLMITCSAGDNVAVQLEALSPTKTAWNLKSTTSQDLPSWCSFQGVTCGNVTGSSTYARILSIGLADLQLNGSLPSSIGNFSLMSSFDIINNRISGTIPTSIGFLTSLKRLVLTSNSLRGTIPYSVSALTKLKYLGMIANNLIGTIPHSIGNFGSLTFLGLGSNLLNGTIPDTFSALKNLEIFDLHSNRVRGTIPSFVSNLEALLVVDLNSNSLTGTIPDIFRALKMLRILYLYSNSVTGEVPSSLSSLTAVTILDLGSNSLTGTIPNIFTACKRLETFNLNSNLLRGTIPSSFRNLTALRTLDLGLNSLSGTIPDIFSGLEDLSYVDISNNILGGEFPAKLLNCHQLKYVDLSMNKIVGSIPSNISALSSLESLKLRSNALTGTIPSKLSSLLSLTSLDLYSNFLTMGGATSVPVSTFSPAALNGTVFNISQNCLVFLYKSISVKATHCAVPAAESTAKPSSVPSANSIVVTVRVVQEFTCTAHPTDILLKGSNSQDLFEGALRSTVEGALGTDADDKVVLESLTEYSFGRRTYLTVGMKAAYLVSVTNGINAEELRIKISNFTASGLYTKFMAVPFPTSSITANGLPSVTIIFPSTTAPDSNKGNHSYFDSYTYWGFLAFLVPIGIAIAILYSCISCRRKRGHKNLNGSDYPDTTESDGLRNASAI